MDGELNHHGVRSEGFLKGINQFHSWNHSLVYINKKRIALIRKIRYQVGLLWRLLV